jgi:uncharacterized damage-inducible protein DinB
VTGEKRTLRMFLQAQRDSVLAIVEGLDAEQLRTSLVPSGWSPLGMVEHLGHAERHWFQEIVLGAAGPLPWPDGQAPSTAAVFEFYRAQCRRSDEVLLATPLSTPPRERHPGSLGEEITDLRGVVLHMIEETARHAGHLDVARELMDGRTGLGPR